MSNPLLDDLDEVSAIPSMDIALPTRGKFYPEDQVLADTINPDQVSVYPLSILDESSIQDPMMMLTGGALDRMIKRIAPGVLAPGKLCDIDVQTILLACRIISHGSKMAIENKCSGCGEMNTMELDLNQHIQNYAPFTEEELNDFEITLEGIPHKVMIRPIPYENSISTVISAIKSDIHFKSMGEIDAMETMSDEFIEIYRKQFEDTMNINVDVIAASIYYVETKSGNKFTDQEYIREWLVKIPSDVVKQITDKIQVINKRLQENSRVDYNCQHCGEKNSFYVELDPQKLFTVAEDSEAKKNSSAEPKSTKKPVKKPSRVSRK